ncbi:MAG: hypothetical protein HC880_12690 [Bacteroidia bacterium]|nr:hypothetical protein [Bacteroidia bacterium]
MLESLTQGNIEPFGQMLQIFAERVFSYHDLPGYEPESFYHAFVLGLLVNLDGRYEIKSNRESGSGRYDIMMAPKKNTDLGIVMEFKRVKPKTKTELSVSAAKALAQIDKKHYIKDLQQRGVTRVFKIGVAARGKEVAVEGGVT